MWDDDKYYTKFDVGDIVIEDISIVYHDDEPMIGLVLNVKRHVYFLGEDNYEIYQDQICVYWFKTKQIENVPSDFINLFSRTNQ